MSVRQRLFGAVGLVIIGGFALVFLGTEVSQCLGPLGRTLVQSLADGCLKPGVGVAVPFSALWLGAAALLVLPIPRGAYRRAGFGALLGGAASAAMMAVETRLILPTTMTGPTSYGEVITVDLPFDWNLLLAAVIAGATIGLIVGARLPRSSRTTAVEVRA